MEDIKKTQYEEYLEKYNQSQKSKERLDELRATLCSELRKEREQTEQQLKSFTDKCQTDLRRLEEEYRTQRESWCTEQMS